MGEKNGLAKPQDISPLSEVPPQPACRKSNGTKGPKHEVDRTGEPCAMKVACTVRRGEVGKVSQDNSPAPYPTNEARRSEKVVKRANGLAVFRAVVKDGKGGIATGTKSEKAASFPDYIEKAETGAIGRALAALGYGTQFAPDLDEQHRIVDAPVDRSTHVTDGNGQKPLASVRSATVGGNGKTNGTTVEEGATDAPATDQQLTSIRKLCQHLGKPEPEHPETMSYQDAKALITQLSHEYNEQKQHRKAS
jgi:hypothetical protein